MRALTAVLIIAACSCRSHAQHATDIIPRVLDSLIGDNNPVQRLFACGRALGHTKCLKALSVWRAEQALDAYETKQQIQSNLTADVESFPWKKYSNVSDELLYSQLCDGTERLLQHRSMSLNIIPGYSFELESNKRGKLNVDVNINNATESARGSMKKFKKSFYNILPLLLVPGLIMSAILPFVLPALKMMTVGVGMLNNMALMSAIFTLLRNNAFNDKYNHKVLYVNAGYKNEEKLSPYHSAYDDDPQATHEHFDIIYQPSEIKVQDDGDHAFGEDFDNIEELPSTDPISNYYDGNKLMKVFGNKFRKTN